jgi:aldehyde:ferredoxin oxidoreductase
MSIYGYAGKILKVDLSSGEMTDLQTEDYAERFVGGRGLAAKLYWDNVPPGTPPLDSANLLTFTGPAAAFTRIAGSRWQVCGRSPAMDPSYFAYGNLGGSFGAWLKFSGYDALALQGASDKLVYLFINDGKVEIKDASHLRGKDAIQTREIIQSELGREVRVAATGQAGENMVGFANVIANDDSSGAGGMGCVMGSKKLKAVAIGCHDLKRPVAAHPEKLDEVALRIHQLRAGHGKRHSIWWHEGHMKDFACFGCVAGCSRKYYQLENGEKIKFHCHFADMYEDAVVKRYGRWNEVVVHAAGLVHRYAIDSFVIEPMVAWLDKCYEQGILSEKETGLPLSTIGTPEFLEALIRKISSREGFGDILALGTLKAAKVVGKGSEALIGDSIITRANDLSMYDPRMYLVTGLIYATEPRKAIQQLHEVTGAVHGWHGGGGVSHGYLSFEDISNMAEKFWGSKAAADFSNYAGKALAAKKIQDRAYVKECLIVCDFLWPTHLTRDIPEHVGDPDLESRLYNAITGVEVDEADMNKLGERAFNIQRAIRMTQGWGGRDGDRLMDATYNIPIGPARFNAECIVPGADGKPVSMVGNKINYDEFEQVKSEYYALRGWDAASGYQTVRGLKDLGLPDVAEELLKQGLVK